MLNALLRLGAGRKPRTLTYEQARALHLRYPIRDGYKYDAASKEERAATRLDALRNVVDLSRVRDVAEVGAGDGRLSLRLHQDGKKVHILDAADWRDEDVRTAGIPFARLGASGDYPLPDGSVDLVVSYNTMEHIPDPAEAVREMIRIVRPGGSIYLSFCPIYNSPFGLHAYRTYFAPYPQFLLAGDDLQRFVADNGINDLGGQRTEFQYVNGWTYTDYKQLVAQAAPAARCRLFAADSDRQHLAVVYRYLGSFWGRNLDYDELTVDHVKILLEKE